MNPKTLADLKAAAYNPRQISERDMKALVKSLQEFGDISGVVFNRATGNLVGGHQRVNGFKEMGGGEITLTKEYETPTEKGTVAEGYIVYGTERYAYRVVEWSEDREKAANLAANKIQGTWDEDRLAKVLMDLKDKVEVLLTGFTAAEMNKLIDGIRNPTEDDFDEEEALEKVEPASKAGDMYILGKHRVICGSATDPHVYKKLLDGERAQMVFTDPPYNVDYKGSSGGKREGILNDKMSGSMFYAFMRDFCQQMLMNVDGSTYICMSTQELGTLKNAFEEAGGHWQSTIIWVKNTFTLSGADYQHTYEPIIYGWPKRIKDHYFYGARDGADVWEELSKVETKRDGDVTTINFAGFEVTVKGEIEAGTVRRRRQKTDIMRFDKPTKSALHPTMKPIALVSECIKNSSKKGDIVLDPFLGSGSTVIAADKMERRCYGIELDPKYVDVIVKRWEDHTGEKAQKV